MSLLDTASLLLTPNAYKEGKLYSVIPSDGSGDFTFTRATTATRVNSDGLVELVPYNLFTYSEQFDNAIWEKNTGTTVTANYSIAPNGTLTADRYLGTASTSGIIERFSNFTVGQQLTLSIYVKANVSGSLNTFRLFGDSTVVSADFTATTDWQRFELTITVGLGGASRPYGIIRPTSGSDVDLSIWGAQLVEGTNALPYQRTETRLNIPRLDYSLGGCPNILLEPQRTNLALQSSSFDSASWTKLAATAVANTIISPSGIQDADTLKEDSTSGQHALFSSGFSISLGATITASVYAKNNGRNLRVGCFSNSFATAFFGLFDMSNGTFISSGTSGLGTFTSYTITSVGDGWYRITVTGVLGGELAARFTAYLLNGTNNSYLGNNVSGVYLWGAQLEAGAYATSYIPTTTASVTRNAEVYNRTGISSLIGQTEGTMFVDFFAKTPSELRRMSISDGTLNNRIVIVHRTTGEIQFIVVNGGVTQADFVTSAIYQSNQEVKVAFAYKANDFIAYINGVQAFTDTSGTVPTTSRFGFTDGDGTSFPFNNSVKLAGLWKERLTNDELAQLTTI